MSFVLPRFMTETKRNFRTQGFKKKGKDDQREFKGH